MRNILIDEDIYTYIASHTMEIGESASDILRRLLGLNKPASLPNAPKNEKHELTDVLNDPMFPQHSATVYKFLFILGAIHADKGEYFEKVLSIQGRGRKYFAKSKRDIEKSGTKTEPKQIPNSQYWVMTNSNTDQKTATLKQVMKTLGYSEQAMRAAVSAIR